MESTKLKVGNEYLTVKQALRRKATLEAKIKKLNDKVVALLS